MSMMRKTNTHMSHVLVDVHAVLDEDPAPAHHRRRVQAPQVGGDAAAERRYKKKFSVTPDEVLGAHSAAQKNLKKVEEELQLDVKELRGSYESIREGERIADKASGRPIASGKLLAPVARPTKLSCAPTNYQAHIAEMEKASAQAGYPVVSVLLLIALVLWETHRLMDRTPGQLVVLTRTTIATMFVTFVLSAIYAAQLIPYFARINIR